MVLWTEWWAWMTAALVLATLEVLIPGYVFLGFAAGAAMVGLLTLIGLSTASLPLTLLIFALLSLGAYIAMRKIFGLQKGQVKLWDTDINDN